jgi:hypothetical protein
MKNKVPITSFRARQCPRDGKIWLIIEWKEGSNTEITGVVMMENGDLPLSCLLVRGIGLDCSGGAKRYEETWLEWVVGEIGHLKELFLVARFWLGAAHWPKADISNISVEGCLNHGKEEYYSGLRLLTRQKKAICKCKNSGLQSLSTRNARNRLCFCYSGIGNPEFKRRYIAISNID